MRKEVIFCDGCGKDITNANFVVNHTHMGLNIRVDDVVIPAHGYVFFDVCSWECYLKVLQIKFYEEATKWVNMQERKLIKQRLSKVISDLGDD